MSQQPHLSQVRLLPWRWTPIVIDVALVALFALLGIANLVVNSDGIGWIDIVDVALAVVAIAIRRITPEGAMALAGSIGLLGLIAAPDGWVALLAMHVVLFHLATVRENRTTVIATLAMIGLFLALVFAGADDLFDNDGDGNRGNVLISIAWPGFVAAFGTVIRKSKENLLEAQQRAHRAEATRELEAASRVTEERLRIARDVHDVVAHHLAVINVQSGVASHLMRDDADTAEAALGEVRGAASTAINELGTLLGALREPDDVDPTAPPPDLAAIAGLVASMANAGLAVDHQRSGAPRDMTISAQIAAFRIAQEALTNAHKHGAGSATLSQTFDDQHLRLRITNPISGAPATAGLGSGYGIIGMTERAEAVGGTLTATPANGTFVVNASLPVGGAS